MSHSEDNLWRAERMITDSPTISMAVEEWKEGQREQTSAVHRINGYPWRLRLIKCSITNDRHLPADQSCNCAIGLICDKSKETILWMCAVKPTICYPGCAYALQQFNLKSWDPSNHYLVMSDNAHFILNDMETRPELRVLIEMDSNDGETWTRRPVLDPEEPFDGFLVFGEDDKKIQVNKKSLATLSTFFDRLFFGSFKERDMNEIPIEDVEYEEFLNLLNMIYNTVGDDGYSLTDENVHRVLQLAGRFDFKIVEEICVNYILSSSSSSLSTLEKLLLSEENHLPFLKDRIIERYSARHMRILAQSPTWESLSNETTRALTKRSTGLIGFSNRKVEDVKTTSSESAVAPLSADHPVHQQKTGNYAVPAPFDVIDFAKRGVENLRLLALSSIDTTDETVVRAIHMRAHFISIFITQDDMRLNLAWCKAWIAYGGIVIVADAGSSSMPSAIVHELTGLAHRTFPCSFYLNERSSCGFMFASDRSTLKGKMSSRSSTSPVNIKQNLISRGISNIDRCFVLIF